VRVTPLLTKTPPVTTYGLLAKVHVVSEDITPDTFVSANTAAGRYADRKISSEKQFTAFRNKVLFFILPPP
jgi:hypothetical protein